MHQVFGEFLLSRQLPLLPYTTPFPKLPEAKPTTLHYLYASPHIVGKAYRSYEGEFENFSVVCARGRGHDGQHQNNARHAAGTNIAPLSLDARTPLSLSSLRRRIGRKREE